MGEHHTKQFPKLMKELDLSLHAGKPTVPEGLGSSTVLVGRAAILVQRFGVSINPRLGSRVVAGEIDYKGTHSKQVFNSSGRRALSQSTKKKQSYRSRRNGFVFQATSLSAGETRPDKSRAGEHQSFHEPKEMGNAKHRNAGTKGRTNRRTSGGTQGRCHSHGRSGKSPLQTGETGRRANQGAQQDLGCYSRGQSPKLGKEGQRWWALPNSPQSSRSTLQKSMYSINSRLGYHMYVNHQKLEFWILLCKDEGSS
jgi:hypothetical protein